MRKVIASLLVLLALAAPARAQTPTATPTSNMCPMVGTIADIYGIVGEPVRVSYQGIGIQQPGGVVIPGGSSCSIMTDALGNLPTSGECTSFVINAIINVTIGSGQPVQIQIPATCPVNLSTLIHQNSLPPPLPYPPGQPPELASWSGVNAPAAITISGGPGQCSLAPGTTGILIMTCPGYALLSGAAFTGAISAPSMELTGSPAALATGAHLVGSTWIADSTAAVIENMTPSGIFFDLNTGLTPGNPFTPTTMATMSPSGLSLPGGLALGASSILTAATINAQTLVLTNPLSPANGGTGVATAPGAGQILIGQASGNYAPYSVSGDAALSSSGVLTVSKINGVAPGPLYSATTPLSVANGGRGSGAALTAGQIDIAQSATAFAGVAMSGDCTIASTGAITCTKINGVSGPFLTGAAGSITDTMLASAYSGVGACTGGLLVSGLNRNAAPTCVAPPTGYPNGAPAQLAGYSATNVAEAETLSGDSTVTRAGAGSYVMVNTGLHFGTNAVALPVTAPTSGGIPYFSSATAIASSGVLTLNAPVLGGGAGAAPTVGSRSGSTTVFATSTGTLTAGDCVKLDAAGNYVDAGGACATTGGPTFPTGSPPQFAGFASTNVSEAETLGGDATFTRASAGNYSITVTKINGVAGPFLPTAGGTVTGNLTVSGTLTQNGAANFNSGATVSFGLTVPNYMSVNGTSTLSGAVTAGNGINLTGGTYQVNGVNFGGACSAGQWVNSISSSVIPSCSAVVSMVGTAPSTPYNGQLWYNTTDLQTYVYYNDGTSSQWVAIVNLGSGLAPANNPTFTGTMTFPDGSTYTSGGHQNMLALGIGAPAPTAAGGLLQATYNGNAGAIINLSNSTAGTNAGALMYFVGDAHSSWIMHTSSLYNGSGPNVPGDALEIASNGANGMMISTNATLNPGPPIVFWAGPYKVATMNQINNGGTLVLPNVATSSLFFGSTTTPLATLTALTGTSNANLSLNAGAHYNGSQWIADNATVGSVALNGSQVVFYSGVGNTVGSPVTNTAIGIFNQNLYQVSGLILGGYAGAVNNNNGTPAIMLGNGYYGGETWAELDQSGATYLNINTGQWIADGGAGSGVGLYQQNQGTYTWWGAGGYAGGAAVAWNEEMQLSLANGLAVEHIFNNASYGVPSCTNCTSITSYSRDTSGYIQVSGTWPITLTFAKAFLGSAICTGNDLSSPPNNGFITFGNNTTTSIQIWCTMAGGAACSSQAGWISYHCFGGA